MIYFLVVFIYAVVGMSLFQNVKYNGVINDFFNFGTWESSMLILFQLSTSAGWNDVTDAMSLAEPDCNSTHAFGGTYEIADGDCGSRINAQIYFSSYIMFVFMIVVSAYVAVMLENLDNEESREISRTTMDQFYEVWSKHTGVGAGLKGKMKNVEFIKYEKLQSFLSGLEQPLWPPAPASDPHDPAKPKHKKKVLFSAEDMVCTDATFDDLKIPLYSEEDVVARRSSFARKSVGDRGKTVALPGGTAYRAHCSDILAILAQRYLRLTAIESLQMKEIVERDCGRRFPGRAKVFSVSDTSRVKPPPGPPSGF